MEITLDPEQYNAMIDRILHRMGEPEKRDTYQVLPNGRVIFDVFSELINYSNNGLPDKSLKLGSDEFTRQIRQMMCSQNIFRGKKIKMIKSSGYIADQKYLIEGNYLLNINPRTEIAYMFRLSNIEMPTLFEPEISPLVSLGSEYHLKLSSLMREGGGIFVGNADLKNLKCIWLQIDLQDVQQFIEEPYRFL